MCQSVVLGLLTVILAVSARNIGNENYAFDELQNLLIETPPIGYAEYNFRHQNTQPLSINGHRPINKVPIQIGTWGDYAREQCDDKKGYCFCVHPKTGEPIPGTRVYGRTKCN